MLPEIYNGYAEKGVTMSLVIAFAGSQGAIIAGDMREILFGGDDAAIKALEAELYNGKITEDDTLKRRADELGVTIVILDTRTKVFKRGDVLIGQVGERERGLERKRRIYATAGGYALAEIEGSHISSVRKGKAGNFIVLGNDITKKVAHQCIKEYWKSGNLADAVRVIVMSMDMAFRMTASVSRKYNIVQTRTRGNLDSAIAEDMEE